MKVQWQVTTSGTVNLSHDSPIRNNTHSSRHFRHFSVNRPLRYMSKAR